MNAAEKNSFEKKRIVLMNHLHDVLCEHSAVPPLENFQPDGTWSDVDYDDKSRGSSWSPMLHLSRMKTLASAEPRLAVRALEGWLKKSPSSPNWWHGCIGIPKSLCETILILRPENLPEGLLKQLEPAIRRADVRNPITGSGQTGQNLLWVEEIRLCTGLLYGQPGLVREGYRAITAELKTAAPGTQGLQDDFSYHQHGPQLQTGNYGLSFLEEQIRYARAFRGTSLACKAEQLKLLDLYFMNGMRWTLGDGRMDYQFCGRQLWEGAPENKYETVLRLGKELMALLPAERQAEYRQYYANPEAFSGAAAYPRSGCLVFRAPEWRFSLKMSSAKIIGCETVNSENLRGRCQGDGVCFFGNLKRYAGYPALFDPRLLPGTTEVQNRARLACCGLRNTNGSCAVLAEFPFAVAAMRMDAADIQADKVWFCTPSGVTCAGSAIRSDSSSPVVTAVDQFREDSEKDFPVEYTGTGIRRCVKRRRGNWKEWFGDFPEKTVCGRVVTLVIGHGIRPRRAAYWYTMRKKGIPAENETRLQTSSGRIHALLAGEYILTAAFVKGSVRLENGKQLRTLPGIALWTRSGTLIRRKELLS